MRLCVLHWQLSSMVRPMFRYGARAARSSVLYKDAQLGVYFPPLPVGGDRRAYTPACACACCIGSSLRWSARCFVMAHGPREVRPGRASRSDRASISVSAVSLTKEPTRPHAPVRAALAALFDGPPDVSLWGTGGAKFGLI